MYSLIMRQNHVSEQGAGALSPIPDGRRVIRAYRSARPAAWAERYARRLGHPERKAAGEPGGAAQSAGVKQRWSGQHNDRQTAAVCLSHRAPPGTQHGVAPPDGDHPHAACTMRSGR
ncbi:hypothetical protein [Paenibacillus chitinolyticus]